MKTINPIILLLILILCFIFTRCTLEETTNTDSPVRIYHYSRWRKTEIDTLYYNKKIEKDTLKYTYTRTRGDIFDMFYQPINNDSFLYSSYDNRSVYRYKLKLKTTISVNNKNFTIKRYCTEPDINASDGDDSYFFNKHYGILSVRSDSWGSWAWGIEYDNISRQLLDSIINGNKYSALYPSAPPAPPPLPSIPPNEQD